MIFFDYIGHNPYRENVLRWVVMAGLILIAAVLLFPFRS
jgi:hypothetical protein